MSTIQKQNLKTARTMEELLGSSVFVPKYYRLGDIVTGTVVKILKDEIILDIKAKSEGVILEEDIQADPQFFGTLKEGDKITAHVAQTEDRRGFIILSTKKAAKEQKWDVLQRAFSSQEPLEVKVIEYNKGGVLVDVEGLRGFVPISHLSKKNFAKFNKATANGGLSSINEKIKEVLGESIRATVIEVDKVQNRVVMSEKVLESGRIEKEAKEKMRSVKVGSVLKGTVLAILPFGILVDCGGVNGLVHLSEISWDRTEADLNKVFDIGDAVEVKVISIDEKQGKLGLSIRALKPNPWSELIKKYEEGQVVKGVVTKVANFGAFVELEPHLEGLIHISETAGPLNVGDKIKVMVVSVDAQAQKLSLSVRKIEESKIYK